MTIGSQLPTIETAQVITDCQKPVADRLLGTEAYQGMGTLLKPEVVHFVATLLSLSWNRYRKVIRRDMNKIDATVQLAHETWIGEQIDIDLYGGG